MTELRKSLTDRMIKLYGYESVITLNFIRCAERWPNDEQHDCCLKALVETHEADPFTYEY